MSRLLGNLTKHNGEHFYCNYCLHRFSRRDLLDTHLPYCQMHKPQRIQMPQEGKNILKFENVHFQAKTSFVIYADFESVLVKHDSCSVNPITSSSEAIASHIPCGYAYVVIGPNGEAIEPPVVYRGQDAVDHFLSAIEEEGKEISEVFYNPKPLSLSSSEEIRFRQAINCHICQKRLGNDRVRDHDHVSGKYIFIYFKNHKCVIFFYNL